MTWILACISAVFLCRPLVSYLTLYENICFLFLSYHFCDILLYFLESTLSYYLHPVCHLKYSFYWQQTPTLLISFSESASHFGLRISWSETETELHLNFWL